MAARPSTAASMTKSPDRVPKHAHARAGPPRARAEDGQRAGPGIIWNIRIAAMKLG